MAKLLGKAPNQVPTNADLGTMAFQDREGINVNNAIVANLVVTGATSVNTPFAAVNASANVLYAAANGNIGIGTGVPAQRLQVEGGNVRFVTSSQGDLVISHSSMVSTVAAAASVQLALGAGGSEAVRVSLTGNVGIGNTAPAHKLSVNGTVRFDTNYLYIDSATANTSASIQLYTANTGSYEYLRFVHPGGNVAFDTGYDTAASLWYINRFNTSAAYVDSPITVSRATGNIVFNTQQATVNGGGLTFNGTNNSRTISIVGNTTGTETGFQLRTNATSTPFAILAVGSVLVIKDDNDATPRFEIDTAGNTFNFVGGNVAFSNSVSITGNLTVSGTTTYINTTNLNVGDNIITLNADLGAVSPTENAGIEVNRGTSANVSWIWHEGRGRWGAYPPATFASTTTSIEAYGNNAGIYAVATGNSTSNAFAAMSASADTATIALDSSNSISGASKTTLIELKAPDYRGSGIYITQTTAPQGGANAHWFVGKPYTGGAFQIGYGVTPEYQSNAVFFIAANTNVGVGNNAPIHKLVVAGNTHITTGDLRIDNGYLYLSAGGAMQHRTERQRPTVLTPHPLEAARLLGCDVRTVQSDRLHSAQALSQATGAVVVLKGSGTVIAAPHQTPVINASGHPRLASAGTGDVLAGLIGSRLAQGQDAHAAACQAVAQHGWIAQHWPQDLAFDAGALTARVS